MKKNKWHIGTEIPDEVGYYFVCGNSSIALSWYDGDKFNSIDRHSLPDCNYWIKMDFPCFPK